MIQLKTIVDVADNNASGVTLAPGTPAQYNSVDSGNLYNWFGFRQAIPTLSMLALGVLALALMGVARNRMT